MLFLKKEVASKSEKVSKTSITYIDRKTEKLKTPATKHNPC